jgi:hypothetical protein
MSKRRAVSKAQPEVFRRDNTAVIKVTHDRHFSRRTLRNQEAAIERRRRVGASFEKMTRILNIMLNGHATCNELLRIATTLSLTRGLKVDRQAKRTKDNLICWFCEHFPQLLTNDRFDQLHQLDRVDRVDEVDEVDEVDQPDGETERKSKPRAHNPHQNMIPIVQSRPTSIPIGIWCGVRLVAPPPFRDSISQPIPSQISTAFGDLELFDLSFIDDVINDIDNEGNDDKEYDDNYDHFR